MPLRIVLDELDDVALAAIVFNCTIKI